MGEQLAAKLKKISQNSVSVETWEWYHLQYETRTGAVYGSHAVWRGYSLGVSKGVAHL